MLSLLIDRSLSYPEGNYFYSPDEAFPEYRYAHLSMDKNPVYRAVRECFAQAGYDAQNIGTHSWNPLGKFIPPGSNVFVLCNFANERRSDELPENYHSRCTHGSVLRALIDYILIAVGETGHVKFGNAPTQVCHWDAVLNDTGATKVLDFYRARGKPVEAKDLRLFVADTTRLGSVRGVERRDEVDGVPVNLGTESLFFELDQKQNNHYRVMNYNPKRTASFHFHGHHEYVINRHILESDVVFSVPKLKTHEKVAMSCAIKGMVGTVGHKDSLPHHRYGPPSLGGDEYPSDAMGLQMAGSIIHERIQQTKPDTQIGSLLRMSYKVYRRLISRWSPVVDGAWWGNDTAWRMALELARIATYANSRGEMQVTPARKHLVLIDGIVGGEGEGPAHCTAVNSGVLLFGDDLASVDFLCASLMGFDPEQIPMVREALHLTKYSVLLGSLLEKHVMYNGQQLSMQEFINMEWYHFQPQDGWKEKLRLVREH